MNLVPGPPPSTRQNGPSGVTSVRLSRTSTKNGELTRLSGGVSTSNQEVGNNKSTSSARARKSRQDSRRDALFSFKTPRQEQLESNITILTLQENLSALGTFNHREKMLSASLKGEVARLTEELQKLSATREAEKVEQEQTIVLEKKTSVYDREDQFLPNIRAGPAPTISTSALQQHEIEVIYQRRVNSLENRCLHMTENNKKLLDKIQQLEKCQTEAEELLESLRQDNTRLSTTGDGLSSTISSQSAVIVGLRSTVQRLIHEERLVADLRNSLERCQRELEAVKKREKNLQEDHVKLKSVASQEKETMMRKILDFQQRLQRNDTIKGNIEALEIKLKTSDNEKKALEIELNASISRSSDLQTRFTELEKLSEEFLQVKRTMELEKAEVEAELNVKRKELEVYKLMQKETEAKAREAEARNANVQEVNNMVRNKDGEIATLMQKVIQLEEDVEDREQRYKGLQNEMNKVNTELNGLKKLSQDDTVQALQRVRQKAGTYEALTLLNEEKKALEEQLRLVQERLKVVHVALQEEKDAKEEVLVAFNANVLTTEELRTENKALLAQMQSLLASAILRTDSEAQTIEEFISPETHAQVVNELESTTMELENTTYELANLQRELDEVRENQDEIHKGNEDLRQNQEQIETGYKKLVSRERYKSESFQGQLKLLQIENCELSDKMASLCKDLMDEQLLNDAQTLELTDLKQRVLSREAIYLLRKTQDSLEQTVNSLLETENASESTFTCLQCMQLFSHPMTLAPCGHTFCAACLAKCGNVSLPSSISCTMCGSNNKEPECIFPNYALADLTARFIFRQQSLASLTTMCLSLRNSFNQRDSNLNSEKFPPTTEEEK